MTTSKITKKAHAKMKPNNREEGHWEGKYWCNCLTRNYRLWLGKKRGNHLDELYNIVAGSADAGVGEMETT
jgi:hypothetical protein